MPAAAGAAGTTQPAGLPACTGATAADVPSRNGADLELQLTAGQSCLRCTLAPGLSGWRVAESAACAGQAVATPPQAAAGPAVPGQQPLRVPEPPTQVSVSPALASQGSVSLPATPTGAPCTACGRLTSAAGRTGWTAGVLMLAGAAAAARGRGSDTTIAAADSTPELQPPPRIRAPSPALASQGSLAVPVTPTGEPLAPRSGPVSHRSCGPAWACVRRLWARHTAS